MTILVTGGAGYIGSHMSHELADLGRPIVVVDNLTTGFRWALPETARLVVGDIGDQDLIRATIDRYGVTGIIHFAGSIVVPESVADPLGYYLNNTVKSRSLIEAAVISKVKHFIFSSTAAVYGMAKEMPVRETTGLEPMSPYGSSKLMTEIMLRDTAFAHPEFNYVALRYFNVAGADPRGRTGQSTKGATHLIKVACETALGKRPGMEVFGTDYDTPDGTCVRDYIHVTDLARAHVAALGHLEKGGKSDIFNCGYGKGYSVLEVLDAVRRVSGKPMNVKMSDRRPGDPAMIVAASEKIRATLAWQPALDDLDGIVANALAWEDALGKRNKT
ncbi:MAG TPA: UDP-glucose 4-epimerase GalE [Hyphomicrobiaceae bacterium]|nr:UDP-glucose 4-epimerase GalE [Hyphomicrobiaceae bacterium]